MLPIAAILVLLFTPLVMLVIRLTRPNFAYFYLAALSGAMLAWPLILLARQLGPDQVPLEFWTSGLEQISTPTLRIDWISWPFAFAIATLCLSVILSAVARVVAGWRAWAGSLTLAGLSIFAVLAGNPLTLLTAWAALDLIEIITLFAQIKNSKTRERIVAIFSARAAGMALLVWAAVAGRSAGVEMTFDRIPREASIYLFLAAGLRLGVLPLHIPFLKELPIRRGLGTTLRLATTGSSLVLLVRAAEAGAPPAAVPYLLALTGLAALYGAWGWATAESELDGRSFWILSTSALAFAAAVRGLPQAALAWSLACLFSGGMLFLASFRPRQLLPLLGLGFLGISTAPFTSAWAGASLYRAPFSPLLLLFIPVQVMLLAGYARHSLHPDDGLPSGERYIRVIYPLALALLPIAHFLSAAWAGLFAGPHSLVEWLVGPIILGMGLAAWAYRRSFTQPKAGMETFAKRFFSFNWLYQGVWRLYGWVGRGVWFLSVILEGQAGVLWSLVLLALLLSLLQQSGLGGQLSP